MCKSVNILWIFFLLSSLFSCSKGDNNETITSRTVLVYMMADNNLSDPSSAGSDLSQSDIEEMVQGMQYSGLSKCNLLIYVDKYNSTPQLIKIEKNSFGKVVEKVVKQYDEQISTDESVMKSVFSYVFSTYPSKNYGLVLWSHGEGWMPYVNTTILPSTSSALRVARWIGQDTNGYTIDNRLNISTLASVLSSAPHFDFILFDACFMSSVEALYNLRSYADYFIASPTEIPGPGAYYVDEVPAMFAASNVGEKIANAYFSYYNTMYAGGDNGSNTNWTFGVSVTLLKSSEMANLASATKQILPNYITNGKVIDTSKLYCYDPYREKYYYDMNSFMKQITGGGSDYDTWKTAYDACVMKYSATPTVLVSYLGYGEDDQYSTTGSTGLSMYIPITSMTTENTAFKQTAWYSAAGWNNTGW